jgi:acetyltransferase-like isoleucine patch superfamily enzyme
MRFVRTVFFSIKARCLSKSRVSISAYIKGTQFITLGMHCKIHNGASIDASCGGRIELGNHVTINRYAYIQGGGGIRIGSYVEINNFCVVDGTGGVEIGDGALIGPGVRIISYQHRFAGHQAIRQQGSDTKPISIGRDVWIGANAVIMAGCQIGEGSIVGAGAVVTHDVPAWVVVAGVPARVIKLR